MIKQIAHICINTSDLRETERFYGEALGLEKKFEFVRHDAPFGFYLDLGNGTFIEVFRGETAPEGNIRHVAIQVEDLGGLVQRIRDCGYDVTDPKMGADHSWQAWVTDPNGVRIEFHEYTPESRQLVGGVCEMN